ncbi:hypothetical protein ASF96_10225 [Microbacterium sp. Leaf179]|nr:hypothetical protein ASF96_10225 [Microbacterium sp. Leaf179]
MFDGAAGAEVELLALAIDEFPTSPWGVELSAQWTTVKGLMIPQSIQILSVGPNPVPAGVTIQALCASALDRAPTVPDGITVSVESAGNRSLVQLTVTAPLMATDSRSVLFERDDATTVPVVNPAVVSRVSVDVGEDPRMIRQTGKLSIFPLTDSGIPVSTFKELSATA